jgi:hypothetical protein
MEEAELIEGMQSVVDKTLHCYARNWVDLDRIFQFKI